MTTHTDPKLLEALRQAAQRKLTAEEIREQKVSFVYGQMGFKSGITKERVRELLDEHCGLRPR